MERGGKRQRKSETEGDRETEGDTETGRGQDRMSSSRCDSGRESDAVTDRDTGIEGWALGGSRELGRPG